MFALEINFRDGVSQPEMVFVRRPQALIGATDQAHIVVDDLKQLDIQLRLVRDVGRRFRCRPLGGNAASLEMSTLLEGMYEGETEMDLGPVKLHFTALDADLMLRDSEPPDRAGVRVLRQACVAPSPLYPAIIIGTGPASMVVSFVPDQPVYIGRAKQCALRLDSADISSKHARLGFESGEFWIEDLGSTNGTFVDGQQIAGRISVEPLVPIVLGRETTIHGVISQEQLERLSTSPQRAIQTPQSVRKYPVLISVSEVARPARLVVQAGGTINIGRDPASELWLGAPHVSRHHCSITLSPGGAVLVRDTSTNGTAYDRGMLRKGEVLELGEQPTVLDFGGGVTIGICFNDEQERLFVSSQGAASAFRSDDESMSGSSAIDSDGYHDSRVLAADSEEAQSYRQERKPKRSNRSNVVRREKIAQFLRNLSPLKKISIVLGVVLLAIFLTIVVSVVVGLFRR